MLQVERSFTGSSMTYLETSRSWSGERSMLFPRERGRSRTTSGRRDTVDHVPHQERIDTTSHYMRLTLITCATSTGVTSSSSLKSTPSPKQNLWERTEESRTTLWSLRQGEPPWL